MISQSSFFQIMNQSSNYSSFPEEESVSNTTNSWDCTREELYTLDNSVIYTWGQTCNKTACYRQAYYSTFYSLIGTFFHSIVFLVGVLGNILVCAVVLKTRSMRTTTNCYLGGSQVKIWVINSYLVLYILEQPIGIHFLFVRFQLMMTCQIHLGSI